MNTDPTPSPSIEDLRELLAKATAALAAWDRYDPNVDNWKIVQEAHDVADALRPFAAALPSLLADQARLVEMVWQDISTAPTEETILVAGGDAKYPVTASWTGFCDEPWQIDGQEDIHGEIGWPTHWMPLPAPPAALTPDKPEIGEGG